MRGMSHRWTALFLLVSGLLYSTTAQADGDMLVVVHRHGDRTPVYSIPADSGYPFDWGGLAPGQLTGEGMHQLWQLGQDIRQQLPSLPANYTSNVLYAHASESDRTLQSSQSMLLGLFPPYSGLRYPMESSEQSYALPFGFQPIAVHMLPQKSDLLVRGPGNCPRYQKYIQEELYPSNAFLNKADEEQELLAQLSDAFGFPVNLTNIFRPYDFLVCEMSHGVPDWRELGQEAINATLELADWVLSHQYAPTEIYSPLIGGELVYSILTHLVEYSQGVTSTPLFLYSAHDTTLSALLSALQEQVTGTPPYASFIAFRLRQREGSWAVRMHFNDWDHGYPLGLCGDALDEEGWCPLNVWVEKVSPWAVPDAWEECQLSAEDWSAMQMWAIAFVWVLLIAVTGAAIAFVYRRSQYNSDPLPGAEEGEEMDEISIPQAGSEAMAPQETVIIVVDEESSKEAQPVPSSEDEQ